MITKFKLFENENKDIESLIEWGDYDGVLNYINEYGISTDENLLTKAVNMLYRFERKIDIIKLLLKNGANVNEITEHNGWTPIFYAVDKSEYQVVDILLDANPNLNIKTKLDRTILFFLRFDKNYLYEKYILEPILKISDIDWNIKDINDKTFIDYLDDDNIKKLKDYNQKNYNKYLKNKNIKKFNI